MMLERALLVVNEALGCDLVVTLKGNEVKGIKHDIDGGRCEMYLAAYDCADLAQAFEIIARNLRRVT